MSKKGAGYRLRKELLAINKDRPEFIWATHKETNILLWSFLVAPPDDTVYGSGWYWGRVTFPQDYPFAPPGIQFVTPSGRFRPETKICMSMSDYHPESWNPAWRALRVLSRRRRDSFPRIMAVGGFFFIFEPFRTASGPSRRRRRDATSDRVERPRCSAQVRLDDPQRRAVVHVERRDHDGCRRVFGCREEAARSGIGGMELRAAGIQCFISGLRGTQRRGVVAESASEKCWFDRAGCVR